MSTHNLCFQQKCEKYQNFYLKIFIFLVVKFSVYLNRRVFVMFSSCICNVVYHLQEQEEVEYTEEEEAIKNNIESDEALSNDILDNIVPNWWHKEPFK